MSITRLQQARQMYAMGQRVAKTLDGSRPGYKGPPGGGDKGMHYSGPSARERNMGMQGKTGQRDVSLSVGPPVDDRSTPTQTYNHNVANRPEANLPPQLQQPIELNKREQVLQNFYNTRPKVNIPSMGLSGMFLNLFNKGVNSPIQKFSDFTTGKNRSFFENVIRAGKIPGLNFGTVAEMTPKQLEDAYQSYMSNRLSGATDAYGNPIGGGGNDDGGGIMDIYNLVNDTDTDTDTDTETEKFVSRFLQNRTPEEIAEIEADIPIRFPNLFT
jgi:hypothetical protein